MDTIFLDSKNSKISKAYVLELNLTDKLYLRRSDKCVALSNLSIYYTWKNIKKSYNNNNFKLSASTWDDEFELPARSYSVSNVQDYFEYIFKKHRENTDQPSVQIHVNKIENRIRFKIKSGCSHDLLIQEIMKSLGSTESTITKDKNGENVPHIEITEIVLIHCSMANNDYQ